MSESLEEIEEKIEAIKKRKAVYDDEAKSIQESFEARKAMLMEEFALSAEQQEILAQRQSLMQNIESLEKNILNLTDMEKDALRDKKNRLERINSGPMKEYIEQLKEIEKSDIKAKTRANQIGIELFKQNAAREKILAAQKKAAAAQKKINELVKKMNKHLDMAQSITMGLFGGIDSKIDGMIKGTVGFADGLYKAALNGKLVKFGIEQIGAAFMALNKMAVELSTILADGLRDTGLLNFEQLLYDNVAATNQFGLSAKDAAKVITDLAQNVSGFALMSGDMQNKMVEQAAALDNLGVSAQESGKLFENLTRGLGMTAGEIDAVGDQFAGLALRVGKSTSAIVSGFNAAQGSLAQFGSAGVAVFEEVTLAATRLGIKAETMFGVFDKTTTFSGAADMAGKLNGVLGTTVDAMELINAENPAETMDILRNSLMDAGKSFDDMTLQQRRFLAEAMGVDITEIQRMMSGEELEPKSPMQIQMEEFSKSVMDVTKIIKQQFNKVFNALAESGILKKIQDSITSIFAEGGAFSFFMDQVKPGLLGFARTFQLILSGVSPIVKGMFFVFGSIARVLGEVVDKVTMLQEAFPVIEMITAGILTNVVMTNAAKIKGIALSIKEKAVALGQGALEMAKSIPKIFGSFAAIPLGIGIPLAVAAVAGLAGLYARYADDYSSQPTSGGGYGDRMLMDKGELIAFNDDDTIIAGTNIQLANDAVSQATAGRNTKLANDAVSQATAGRNIKLANDAVSQATAGRNIKLANDAVSQAVNQKTATQADNAAAAQKPAAPAAAPQGQGQPTRVVLQIDRTNLGEVLMGTDGIVSSKLSISS